jgi:hypothetical protein
MNRIRTTIAVASVAIALLSLPSGIAGPSPAQAQGPDAGLYEGLQWREIGPFRGGRSTAASGVPGRPEEFYMGVTGGGLWKSTNAGVDWVNVSDGFYGTASVGGIGVSASHPDIVYVGMGETEIRGNISHGDGVYKTTDAGQTWTHVGLRDTQFISRVRVHPTDPDIAYVAALGHVYGPNDERGVFRTTDGGRSWEKILFVSNRAGAIDISMVPSDPDALYAATWEAWRTPYSLNSGGPGSKLFKSVDGGENWMEITRNPGLPGGTIGKIGVAVSPVDPNRVYAIVEAEEGGIFRSDDAGGTWRLVEDHRRFRQRAWYYSRIYADTGDPDVFYVLNTGFYHFTGGGEEYGSIGVPHGDNHDLWIDPEDPDRMINANDGGANVSNDGGATWTEQDFATAQFYHVATDNAFPYRIYGAQQDNSTVRIPSRTQGNGIRREDWTSTAGGESGYIAAKPGRQLWWPADHGQSSDQPAAQRERLAGQSDGSRGHRFKAPVPVDLPDRLLSPRSRSALHLLTASAEVHQRWADLEDDQPRPYPQRPEDAGAVGRADHQGQHQRGVLRHHLHDLRIADNTRPDLGRFG